MPVALLDASGVEHAVSRVATTDGAGVPTDANLSLVAALLTPKPHRPDIERFYVDPPSGISGVAIETPVTWHWLASGAVRYEVRDPGGGVRYSGTDTSYQETLSTSPADLDDDVTRTLVAFSATDLQSETSASFRRLDPPTVVVETPFVRDVPNVVGREREAFVWITASGDPFPTTITISPETGTRSSTVARKFLGIGSGETRRRQLHLVRRDPPVETVDYEVTFANSAGNAVGRFSIPW